jgi:carbon-monoxide dehydrogenase medium subunit
MMSTALDEREILTFIELAARKAGEGMAYAKFTHPASRYAVVGAAAAVVLANGSCTGARVAIGGALPAAARASSVEQALVGKQPSAQTIDQAALRVADALSTDVLEDLYASADYRKAMTAVFVKRALTAAFSRTA